jgi:hypothetical protein
MSKINPDFLSFFRNPDASSVLSLAGNQVNAPSVRGQDLTDEEIGMGGGVRLVMHIFDRSPSMVPVTKLMLDGFGKTYVVAIAEARQDDVAALRLAGVSFSDEITPIWQKNGVSFHALEKLPPLTSAEYDPANGNGTALHKAIIEGYRLALEYAAQIKVETGIQPEIDIIVLSDGQNNFAPQSPKPVRDLIQGSKPELVRFIYFFFQTDSDQTLIQNPELLPEKLALGMGFDKENIMVFAQKDGESDADYKKRFRRMLRVMSKVSASKGTSAVQAAAAVQATGESII